MPDSEQRLSLIGFCLPHEQFPAPALIEHGLAAVAAGFEALWASDHFHPWQDNQGHAGHAWITLAALGQRTRDVPLGTGVTCPIYRYRPAEVAQAFASLGVLYPGRIYLGVGTGEAVNELTAGGGWGPFRERAERLTEAIGLIRRLWSGEWVTHHGSYFQVQTARIYDLPPRPVPIYVAAGGPKSMRLAGEHGDGLITDGRSALDPERRAAFHEGARASGKDPNAMQVLVEHYVVVGGRAEAEEGARLWRFSAVSGEMFDVPDPREVQRRAEASVSLEQVYRNWTVSNDPEVHVQAIRDLLAAGVRQVFVHAPQQDQARVIDFYGRLVLPRLRER
jgi:TAT-translocated FGD2 family F420-dependent dehydrogenase